MQVSMPYTDVCILYIIRFCLQHRFHFVKSTTINSSFSQVWLSFWQGTHKHKSMTSKLCHINFSIVRRKNALLYAARRNGWNADESETNAFSGWNAARSCARLAWKQWWPASLWRFVHMILYTRVKLHMEVAPCCTIFFARDSLTSLFESISTKATWIDLSKLDEHKEVTNRICKSY